MAPNRVGVVVARVGRLARPRSTPGPLLDLAIFWPMQASYLKASAIRWSWAGWRRQRPALDWRRYGAFPDEETDLAPAVIAHLAAQVGVGAGALDSYDWSGRTGRRHRGHRKALREIGRLERTLFTLDCISDPILRRRANARLNKGEARNALARAVFSIVSAKSVTVLSRISATAPPASISPWPPSSSGTGLDPTVVSPAAKSLNQSAAGLPCRARTGRKGSHAPRSVGSVRADPWA